MDEETALTICEEKGFLNEKGLIQLLQYAKEEIVSYNKRIKEVMSKKGLHKSKGK